MSRQKLSTPTCLLVLLPSNAAAPRHGASVETAAMRPALLACNINCLIVNIVERLLLILRRS